MRFFKISPLYFLNEWILPRFDWYCSYFSRESPLLGCQDEKRSPTEWFSWLFHFFRYRRSGKRVESSRVDMHEKIILEDFFLYGTVPHSCMGGRMGNSCQVRKVHLKNWRLTIGKNRRKENDTEWMNEWMNPQMADRIDPTHPSRDIL